MPQKRGAPKFDAPVLDSLGHFASEWFPFLASAYATDEKTLTNGATTTVAHRLKSPPFQMWGVLICKTAELGYAVGDETPIPGFEDASDYGVSLSCDATNIYATAGASGVRLMRRSAPIGEFATITNANWRLIVRFEP